MRQHAHIWSMGISNDGNYHRRRRRRRNNWMMFDADTAIIGFYGRHMEIPFFFKCVLVFRDRCYTLVKMGSKSFLWYTFCFLPERKMMRRNKE